MQENQKTLQTIEKEKVSITPSPTTTGQISIAPEPVMPGDYNNLPSNNIMNVIKMLKERQSRASVWFNFELPSNGKCGYPKEIQLRELTTEDEKILIKDMFSSKESSVLNVIRKCAKFENTLDFDFENLTTFDQDFILLELSAITFPGEKDIIITDDANHKVPIKLNKEDLSLTVVPFDLEYPFKVVLPSSNLTWYLNFTTLKKLKEIDKAMKALSADVLTRLFISIALSTEKVEIKGAGISFNNFYEIVKLLESLPPSDLKSLIEFYNEKTSAAYGYKLVKEYYCTECGKGGQMELEPLNFFRITI